MRDDRRAHPQDGGSYGFRGGIRFIRTSASITLTTLTFASFNVGLGALGGAVIATGGLLVALAAIATAIGAPGLVGLVHPALAPAQETDTGATPTDH